LLRCSGVATKDFRPLRPRADIAPVPFFLTRIKCACPAKSEAGAPPAVPGHPNPAAVSLVPMTRNPIPAWVRACDVVAGHPHPAVSPPAPVPGLPNHSGARWRRDRFLPRRRRSTGRAISRVGISRRFEPTDRRHANGRNRRVSLLAVRRGEGRLAEPDRSRSPFAPTQVDGLKIGSDTGTCFKVRV
jgi:hypothetical protein